MEKRIKTHRKKRYQQQSHEKDGYHKYDFGFWPIKLSSHSIDNYPKNFLIISTSSLVTSYFLTNSSGSFKLFLIMFSSSLIFLK